MSVRPSDQGRRPLAGMMRPGGARQKGRIAVIIDTHAHVVPVSLIETLRAEQRIFPSVRLITEGDVARMAFAGEAPTRPITPRLSDLQARKEWLAQQKIDHQVVGGWTD